MGHAALPDAMDMPKRKHPRLKEHDYSQGGAYFITICTRNREHLLGTIRVGRDDLIPPQVQLSSYGQTVERYLQGIEEAYSAVRLARYVIMPNHVHLLLVIGGGMGSSRPTGGEPGEVRPTVPMVVRGFKRQLTMALGKSIWQSSFYEHIIRGEASYINHLRYMAENPAQWAEDEYYREQ